MDITRSNSMYMYAHYRIQTIQERNILIFTYTPTVMTMMVVSVIVSFMYYYFHATTTYGYIQKKANNVLNLQI